MASTAVAHIEETASTASPGPEDLVQPLSPPPPPPPLVSPVGAERKPQQCLQEAWDAEQHDVALPLPLPLPAPPMTRRRKRTSIPTNPLAHYLTATTSTTARTCRSRASAGAHATLTSSSACAPSIAKQQPRESREAATAERQATQQQQSPPLRRPLTPQPKGSARLSTGVCRTSAPHPQLPRKIQLGKQQQQQRAPKGTQLVVPPQRSLVDDVLDEQMTSRPEPQQQQPAVAPETGDTVVVTVVSSERHRKRGGATPLRHRQRPPQRRAEPFPTTGRTEEGRDDSDDSVSSNILEHRETRPLHEQALRLQPLPPAAPASALAEEAGVLEAGNDGDVLETFVDVFAAPTMSTRPTVQSAAQSMLAAERADMAHDSPHTVAEGGTWGAVTNVHDPDTREHLWRPTTQPRTRDRAYRTADAASPTRGAGAALTKTGKWMKTAASPAELPAAVVEFLRAEADAEMAMRVAEPTATGPVDPDAGAPRISAPAAASPARPPHAPPVPLLSPAAESAAVLQELKEVQRRLHEHRHRTETGVASSKRRTQTSSPVAAISTSPRELDSGSPCDVTTSFSSASSTATRSSSTAARPKKRRHGSARRNIMGSLRRSSPEYWAAASLTEIIDVIDGQCTMAPARKQRRNQGTRGAAAFDPTSYARRLLDKTACGRTPSSTSDDTDHLYLDDVDAEYYATGSHDPHARSAPPDVLSPSPARLKREEPLRCGPAWATAASELGLTPAEVQDLLRYSLSSPDAAATWLAVGTHRVEDATRTAEVSVDKRDRPHADRRHTRRAERRDGNNDSDGHGHGTEDGPRSHPQPRPSSRPDNVSLDVAAQTALVQRIVAALPAIPAELQEELSRQRRLLERVCRDVRFISTPVHAAVQARLTSPTVSSMAARQPSPMELCTVAGRGGVQTNPHGVTEKDEAHQDLAFASLPRPAARALMAVSGLHSAAADPSRPLPPFHTIVARPSLPNARPATSQPSMNNDAAAPREPYEMALHELAERETHHYISELDRLRTLYDRQLQEERRQRTQDRRQYAELLQSQQYKLLRHHRETVHLLQRECRLQQQQQESLVQRIAASQEAAAQRQLAQHEHSTKHMLAGARDVIGSYVMAVGGGGGGGERVKSAPRARAATTPRTAQRQRQRTYKRHRTAGSPDLPAVAPGGANTTEAATVATEATDTTPHLPLSQSFPDVSPERHPRDADIPTAELLSPPSRSASPTHTAPLSAREPYARSNTQPASPTGATDVASTKQSDAGDAARSTAGGHTGAHHRTLGTTAREASSAAAGAKPSTRRAEALRAVYTGDAKSPPPPPRRPTQGRMTLPLQVRLPPEEDTPTRKNLGAATLAAELADLRATAAACEAGLAEGTRLYDAQPRRRQRRPHGKPLSTITGETVVQRLDQAALHEARLSVSRSPTSATRHARTLSENKIPRRAPAKSNRSSSRRAGRSEERWSSRSPGRHRARAAPFSTVSSGRVTHHVGSRTPRHFDAEIVSLLSSETGTAPSYVPPSSDVVVAAHRSADDRCNPSGDPLHCGGAWVESFGAEVEGAGGGVVPGQATASTLLMTAGVTAGKSAVGRPLLVLNQPAVAASGMELIANAMGSATTPATAALCTPQAMDVQLREALQHRACLVNALRREAPPSPPSPDYTNMEATQVYDKESAGDSDECCIVRRTVGAIPPCDGAFFGAPAEICISASDDPIAAAGINNESLKTTNAALAPLGIITDYARAWARYAAAEREVESCALALAAEDKGILSAVAAAPEHRRHRQRGGDDAVPVSATIARPASTSAAVHYRESELGGDNPTQWGGSVHVSPRMAAEARALTEARGRLSAIRACFITPSSLGTARTSSSASMCKLPGTDTAMRDAALVRQLVDATVWSVLENQDYHSHTDPVRQVMAAMERDILRRILANSLEGGGGIASGGAEDTDASQQQQRQPQPQPPLDFDVALALAEATIEDAVQAALENHRPGRDIKEDSTPSHATAAATITATRIASPPAQAAPIEPAPAADAIPHQHVLIPLTASTAWLRDDPPVPEAAPHEPSEPRQSEPIDPQGKADAITATATVVLPPSRSAAIDATHSTAPQSAAPTSQEVRVLIDLSPMMRHLMMSRDPVGVSPMQSVQPQQPLHRPRLYPPVEEEQLPGPWMALEDRRDVIVETESRVVAEEKKAVLPSPTLAAAAMAPKHPTAVTPPHHYGSLQTSDVSNPPAAVPPPTPASSRVDVAVVPGQDAATPMGDPTPQSALHLSILHLLQSALLDQERLQRANLSDREEEQRCAHQLRFEDSTMAAQQRSLTKPFDTTARRPPSTTEASTAEPHLAVPQRLGATTAVDRPQHEDAEAAGAAVSGLCAPSSPQLPPIATPAASTSHGAVLPPVRDPVMGYVLEWVQQFSASQQLRSSMRDKVTVASSPTLKEGLNAAAQTAAMHDIAPRAQDTCRLPRPNPMRRHAVSQPSTRNLGSSTSIESSSSMSPSSYTSSSSSSLLTDQIWGRARPSASENSGQSHSRSQRRVSARAALESSAAYVQASVRRARPVLDAQRDDASASTGTTRYTTGRNSPTSGIADASKEDRTAPSGSSRLLPPRVSAEVQAALHAHQQANRAGASSAGRAGEKCSQVGGLPLGSSVGNSLHATSGMARSLEATAAVRASPPALATSMVPRNSPAELNTPPLALPSRTRDRVGVHIDDNGEASHVMVNTSERVPLMGVRSNPARTTVVVKSANLSKQDPEKPQPTAPYSTAGWGGNISLTSTSTSSHSGYGVGAYGSNQNAPRAYPAHISALAVSGNGRAAPASSVLPFMTGRAGDAVISAHKNHPQPSPQVHPAAPSATSAAGPLPYSRGPAPHLPEQMLHARREPHTREIRTQLQ